MSGETTKQVILPVEVSTTCFVCWINTVRPVSSRSTSQKIVNSLFGIRKCWWDRKTHTLVSGHDAVSSTRTGAADSRVRPHPRQLRRFGACELPAVRQCLLGLEGDFEDSALSRRRAAHARLCSRVHCSAQVRSIDSASRAQFAARNRLWDRK